MEVASEAGYPLEDHSLQRLTPTANLCGVTAVVVSEGGVLRFDIGLLQGVRVLYAVSSFLHADNIICSV